MAETMTQRLLRDADALQLDAGPRAALELLAWHDYWLHRDEFLDTATRIDPSGAVWISWSRAQAEFSHDKYHLASTSERAILELAIALGTDRYRFNLMGDTHAHAIVRAVTTALGNPS